MSTIKNWLTIFSLIVIFSVIFSQIVFAQQTEWGQKFKKTILSRMKNASSPTKNFSTPTGRVLKSMEVMVSLGSSFGIEENSGVLGRLAIGLGGVAEVELTRSSFMNELTGQQGNLPTSIFKMSLVPERFSQFWFIPNISLQLHSTPWQSSVNEGSRLTESAKASYAESNLSRINMDNRFTTLYGIIGKEFNFMSINGGATLTDVRVRNAWQWIFDQELGSEVYHKIPEMQKNLIAPFGNISIAANNDTQLMGEVQAIPLIDYNIKNKQVLIKRTWRAIVGVRFFISSWLSLDTGVKYLSSAKGIADSEVNVGLNLMVPFKAGS
ncbi:MAG: hypothetical protein JSW07_21030 [bacterium]|nr:MAG: hypothetical protein JSW07_21030 [bacterium]